jgi:hypothetical protein
MLATFQNSGMVLSIGIFFSLMIAGLSSTLPKTLTSGLMSHGVPAHTAHLVGAEPPVSSLFAAFLGYNPVQQLLTPTGVLARLPAAQVRVLTGRQFFPQLISGPFHHGLVIVFSMAMAVLVIAAGASLLRGGRYVHEEHVPAAEAASRAGADGHVPSDGRAAASLPAATEHPPGDGQPAASAAHPDHNGGQPRGPGSSVPGGRSRTRPGA